MLFSLAALTAQAGVTCDSGARHRTLEDAVADLECQAATLDAGVHFQTVVVGRNFTIAGAGRDESILFCTPGPCIHVTQGAELVVVARMSVASTGTTIEAWGGKLTLTDMRIAPLGLDGGDLVLRDAEAQLLGVELEVSELPAIKALSDRRRSLDFDRVHFTGLGRYGNVRNVVYSNSFGVSCTGCSFDRDRHFVVPGLIWGAMEVHSSVSGPSGSIPFSDLSCPTADGEAEAVCRAQCRDQSVALCRMSYRIRSESCIPEATCVPSGEVPGTLP